MKKEIYFVRHGQSESNVKGTFAGQRENSRLTEKGKNQARQAAKDIKDKAITPKKIIVSPLIRTRETLEIIMAESGFESVEVITDERIAEYDMGSLTGTPIRKVTSKELISAEGAENPDLFSERVHGLLQELLAEEGPILIVSHAGVGRIIEAKKRGVIPQNFYDLDPYPNAQVVELDISHLVENAKNQ